MVEFRHEGLRGGIWQGVILAPDKPGRLALVHQGEAVGEAVVAPLQAGSWQVSAQLPFDRVTDGTTSFHLVEAEVSDGPVGPGARRLASLPLIAGAPLEDDLRAEIDQLRAEVELIKREFRRQASADRDHLEKLLGVSGRAEQMLAGVEPSIADAQRIGERAHDRADWAAELAQEARERVSEVGRQSGEGLERANWAAYMVGELRNKLEEVDRGLSDVASRQPDADAAGPGAEALERANWAAHMIGELGSRIDAAAEEASQARHAVEQAPDSQAGMRDAIAAAADEARIAREAVEGAVQEARSAREAVEGAADEARGAREAVEGAIQEARTAREAAETAIQDARAARDIAEAAQGRIGEGGGSLSPGDGGRVEEAIAAARQAEQVGRQAYDIAQSAVEAALQALEGFETMSAKPQAR